MYNNESNYGIKEIDTGISAYISKVFGWMFIGLLFTAFTAFYTVSNTSLLRAVVNPAAYLFLAIIEFGLVIYLSARIEKMSSTTAMGVFLLYSALNGLTLSSIFLVYHIGIIFKAFLVASAVFGVMAVYGYVTKTDLTRVGGLFFMGIIGIIIASLINIFLRSSGLDMIISYIGVFLFLGLTAYDTQKIKEYYMWSRNDETGEMGKKGSIISALALYLDFINIFIFLLRIFGRRD